MAPASVRAETFLVSMFRSEATIWHQALRIGRVVDGEARANADVHCLRTQDPHAHRVERGHPHRPDRAPIMSATRSRISAAALLVKVMARISPGCAPPAASR